VGVAGTAKKRLSGSRLKPVSTSGIKKEKLNIYK
jgi:hypothetical protein